LPSDLPAVARKKASVAIDGDCFVASLLAMTRNYAQAYPMPVIATPGTARLRQRHDFARSITLDHLVGADEQSFEKPICGMISVIKGARRSKSDSSHERRYTPALRPYQRYRQGRSAPPSMADRPLRWRRCSRGPSAHGPVQVVRSGRQSRGGRDRAPPGSRRWPPLSPAPAGSRSRQPLGRSR
jgi:hypothetical protein